MLYSDLERAEREVIRIRKQNYDGLDWGNQIHADVCKAKTHKKSSGRYDYSSADNYLESKREEGWSFR